MRATKAQQLLLLAALLALGACQVAAQCSSLPPGNPSNNIAPGWPLSCIGTAAGSKCVATCRQGYTTKPPPETTCQASGSWGPVTGACNRVCPGMPPADVLPNGEWPPESCNSSTHVTGWCNGRCNTGAGYNGSPRIYCASSGFAQMEGKCVFGPVCGPRPQSPPNGAWPASCIDSAIGETCTAICNPGYTTTPTPTLRCVLRSDGQSGSWQTVSNGGRCEKVCPGKPTAESPMTIWPDSCIDSVRVNGVCLGTCTTNYTGNSRVTCGSQQWGVQVSGKCIPNEVTASSTTCSTLPPIVPTNAGWPADCKDTAVNGRCTAICNQGFKGSPADPFVTCQANGIWSNVVSGSCQRVCDGVPSSTILPNGSWPTNCTNSVFVTGTCKGECSGTLQGNPTVECLSGGTWSISVSGRCVDGPICPARPTEIITNSKGWPVGCLDTPVGQTCTAQCNAGYTASTPTSTCQPGGSWSTATTNICELSPTSCPGMPTAVVANGTFPNSCAGSVIGATCRANCSGGFTGSPQVTCEASGLWSTTAVDNCTDVDACIAHQCTGANTTCQDLPAPAPNAPNGRRCNCTTGLTYLNDIVGCIELNGCADNPCRGVANTTGNCIDQPAPLTGFNCSCTTGLFWNGQACAEVDGCQGVVCAGEGIEEPGICEDVPAPGTEYSCRCKQGYRWNAATKSCANIDACITTGCTKGDVEALCKDNPPPALGDVLGRNCSCIGGYSYSEASGCQNANACIDFNCTGPNSICVDRPPFAPNSPLGRDCSCTSGLYYANDTVGCLDINACERFPCGPNTICKDKDAPEPGDASGRTCSCKSMGLTFINDTVGCLEIDGCSPVNPCGGIDNSNGTCTDVESPDTGFDCGCREGYEWNRANSNCKDIDACSNANCSLVDGSDGICFDNKAPDLGYTCNCTEGYLWNNVSKTCDNIDACIVTGCTLGDVAANCTDVRPPYLGDASGRNCSCLPGYTYSEATGCTNINACNVSACTLGDIPANCTDLPPPFDGDIFGRNCTCDPGYSYTEALGCRAIDSCSPNPCNNVTYPYSNGTCIDQPPPWESFECACEEGYIWMGVLSGCQEFNGCTNVTCDLTTSNGTCFDELAPSTGYTCACRDGYSWGRSRMGCRNIDACSVARCTMGEVAAQCEDKAPPELGDASGRNCSCPDGYSYSEATGCTNIDACSVIGCTLGEIAANCTDLPASTGAGGGTSERNCTCNPGYLYTEAAGCTAVDGCVPNLCGTASYPNSNGTCFDDPVPSTGFSCACTEGYEWVDMATGCRDINGCIGITCNITTSDGTCLDAAAPSLGYSCACRDGYSWNNVTLECENINACVVTGCTMGDVAAICDDIGPPALGDATGRNCSCPDGYSYSEASGCKNINACVDFNCTGPNSICEDLPPTAPNSPLGRNCSCTSGLFYANDTVGCQEINACIEFPCGPNTTCTDKEGGAGDASGRECSCSQSGMVLVNETVGCVDIDGCAADTNPCSNVTNANSTCRDEPAPNVGYICGCLEGYEWNRENGTCSDVNGCQNINCTLVDGSDGACSDVSAADGGGYMCGCQPGYTWNTANKTCNNIDACAVTGCTLGDVAAICDDIGPPALGDALGRNCSCPDGYSYSEASGCTNIDACSVTGCTLGEIAANCTDLPASTGAGGGTSGRNCTCNAGYLYTEAAGCTAVDGCVPNLCGTASYPNSNGTCIDDPVPSTGFSCACTEGYEWVDMATGCQDINGCDGITCNITTSNGTCLDAAAPSLGYSCACRDGYSWNNATLECENINACLTATCHSSSTCDDLPPPNGASGYICKCGDGLQYINDTVGCQDINGCEGEPCAQSTMPLSNGTCIDDQAPKTKFTCVCVPGASWNGTQCIDDDGCTGNPCSNPAINSTGVCRDTAAGLPGPGYECECRNGTAWNSTAGVCREIDGCIGVQCGTGGTCVDTPAPGVGYTCRCGPGTSLNAAINRCEEIDECLGIPCSRVVESNGQCMDVKAPNTGYVCGCTGTRIWDNTTRLCLATTCSTPTEAVPNYERWPATCAGRPIGSTCTVVCKTEFASTPAPTATCQRRTDLPAYAVWSSPVPISCNRVCVGMPPLTLGVMWSSACNNLRVGSECMGSCAAGAGATSILCTSNGVWAAPIVRCPSGGRKLAESRRMGDWSR